MLKYVFALSMIAFAAGGVVFALNPDHHGLAMQSVTIAMIAGVAAVVAHRLPDPM